MTARISTESILITVESNWIQMRLRVKRAKAREGVIRRPKFRTLQTLAFRPYRPSRFSCFLTQARKNRIILTEGSMRR